MLWKKNKYGMPGSKYNILFEVKPTSRSFYFHKVYSMMILISFIDVFAILVSLNKNTFW